jgi:hypothetical protein
MGPGPGVFWLGGWAGLRVELDVTAKRRINAPVGNGNPLPVIALTELYPTLLCRDSTVCNSLKFDTQNRSCNFAYQQISFPHLPIYCHESSQGGKVRAKILFCPNPLCSNRSIRGPWGMTEGTQQTGIRHREDEQNTQMGKGQTEKG